MKIFRTVALLLLVFVLAGQCLRWFWSTRPPVLDGPWRMDQQSLILTCQGPGYRVQGLEETPIDFIPDDRPGRWVEKSPPGQNLPRALEWDGGTLTLLVIVQSQRTRHQLKRDP